MSYSQTLIRNRTMIMSKKKKYKLNSKEQKKEREGVYAFADVFTRDVVFFDHRVFLTTSDTLAEASQPPMISPQPTSSSSGSLFTPFDQNPPTDSAASVVDLMAPLSADAVRWRGVQLLHSEPSHPTSNGSQWAPDGLFHVVLPVSTTCGLKDVDTCLPSSTQSDTYGTGLLVFAVIVASLQLHLGIVVLDRRWSQPLTSRPGHDSSSGCAPVCHFLVREDMLECHRSGLRSMSKQFRPGTELYVWFPDVIPCRLPLQHSSPPHWCPLLTIPLVLTSSVPFPTSSTTRAPALLVLWPLCPSQSCIAFEISPVLPSHEFFLWVHTKLPTNTILVWLESW